MAQVAQALEQGFGVEVTRSTVAGRVKRLRDMGYELEARPVPLPLRKNGHDHAVEVPEVEPVINAPPPPHDWFAPPPEPVVTHDNGVEYSRLGPRACNAILDIKGKDGFSKCCGKQRHNGSVYCQAHHAIYYNRHRER